MSLKHPISAGAKNLLDMPVVQALITLQFKETDGVDSSNSIAATIKSFKATRL